MRVVTTIAEMRAVRSTMSGLVGFVPTMGYLHEGHLSLVRRARQDNDNTVASIFVNPTQFGPHEDYRRYPRNPERDLSMLKDVGTDVVFMPTTEEMYPEASETYIDVGSITQRLEGTSRPGHFRGVATVVAKLFNIVQPHRAYFGQKDAQQLVVIQRMVRDLNMDVDIVPMPTVREPDGLAMSSRNTYLNPEERRAATALWRGLRKAQQLFEAGERQTATLRLAVEATIHQEPLAHIEYVSVADAATLEEVATVDRPALVSLAVRIGQARLIDNITLIPTE